MREDIDKILIDLESLENNVIGIQHAEERVKWTALGAHTIHGRLDHLDDPQMDSVVSTLAKLQ